MRKILLATTALVGFVAAGAAQAATAPLNVTVGGSIDFVAGAFHESVASGAVNPAGGDFETVYSLAFGVTGKAANGIEYGGALVLDNDINAAGTLTGISNTVRVTTADLFMSGAYGKVVLGDQRGVTDMAVTAPSVVGVRYLDFLSPAFYSKKLVLDVDTRDHSTAVAYYTPKVGGEYGKVQAGVSYDPTVGQYGSDVQLTRVTDAYKNAIKGALAYTGNVKGVAVAASADMISAAASATTAQPLAIRAFTSWGAGINGAYQGFTVGFNYADLGHFGTTSIQNKTQQTFGAGIKYEFNKYTVGFNWLGGEGYDNSLTLGTAGGVQKYVKDFNNYDFGAAYTWAPGLTTDINAILFSQTQEKTLAKDNDGYVLLLSQKLAF